MAADDSKRKKRPTALKRDIRNAKRRELNKAFKSRIKTAMRSFETALKEKSGVAEGLQEIYSMMDKAVKRNIFKLNGLGS